MKKKVYQLSKEKELINTWNSMKEAANSLNISQSSISNCCKGKTKSAGGYYWKLEEGDLKVEPE